MPGGPTDPPGSCPAPHISPLALCVSQGGCELAKKFLKEFFCGFTADSPRRLPQPKDAAPPSDPEVFAGRPGQAGCLTLSICV